MAPLNDTHLQRLLAIALPDGLIEKLAVACEVVERKRKIDIVMLVWTLILGFDVGTKRKLASLRRKFEQHTGTSIARSSFYNRLNKKLAILFEHLVDWMLTSRIENTHSDIAERFEGFRQLLAVDSTVIQLHDLLAERWESTQPDEAATKLHVVANIIDGKANSVKLTGQTTPDTGPWKRIGRWVQNSLLMLDLGYYDFHLFHRIDQQDGFFISRVKANANPTITGSNITCRGRSIDLAGAQLKEVLPRLRRRVIDVNVKLAVRLRRYRGRRRTVQKQFRMVGVRNDETGNYHLYFTNIAPETMDVTAIAQAYGLRWQVELLFTRLKTNFRLHQLPTSKPPIVRTLIYASILALLVSNVLLKSMRKLRPDRVFPARRMDAVFRDFSELILLTIASRRCNGEVDLFRLMLHEAADPNRTRERSHDILQTIPLRKSADTQVFTEVCA